MNDDQKPKEEARIVRLFIIGLVTGESSDFDETYVVKYDPTYQVPGEAYCGGLLEVTKDPEKASLLTHTEAFELWRKDYGLRPDGKPNRPLTAFSVVMR